MNDGIHYMQLSDKTYGEINLAVVVPRNDDPWGVLAPLRGTVWEPFIRVVPGEAMSHARYGYAAPLVRVLGPPPLSILSRMPFKSVLCSQAQRAGECLLASNLCVPGKKLPDCYQPPGFTGIVQEVVAAVALAWRDGRYVVVVEGDEFSLT